MKDYYKYNDEQLIKEIKAGNMHAFDALYEKYSKKIYKFSVSILKSSEDAKNIVQDVFMNLWANRNNIEKEESVRYYIFKTAYNTSISVIRKKLRESDYLEYLKTLQEPVENDVDLKIEFTELNEKLSELINSLPKRQREIFILHRIEGLKYEEISLKLGISVNTIETHMSRALKSIRNKLGILSLPGFLFVNLFL